MKRDKKTGRFSAEPNILEEDGQYIYCYTANHELLFFTDLENAQKIKIYNWGKLANGYCSAYKNGKSIPIHRYLIGAKDGELVDHINGNKKDNRLSNLRICNKSQNAYNSKLHSSNKSGYSGIYFRKDTHKWSAEIHNNNKKIMLGCFDKKEDAIKARVEAEKEYMGEFRRVS